ncbi:hypothetical protein SCP_0300460 [Sparassis crispa]|uniref:Uncharacterized protein n=1 Tax=Sparassis crispa TaxID=139825 RepID=A0A401GDW8_9APHY|nr:hypothetical protein SCP_0300460 [Sparassis crispa]GBE80331.1 hypothetical protein SCP_0300460 [Sparassis crispa]
MVTACNDEYDSYLSPLSAQDISSIDHAAADALTRLSITSTPSSPSPSPRFHSLHSSLSQEAPKTTTSGLVADTDASIILRKYTLVEALLRIEIFTEPFNPILWKAWAVRMHVLLVLMVQAQSEAASVEIILPLPCDIPVLAQVKIHLATARTVEGGHQMIPRIADHLPAVIPHGLTARILYDDPAVREDFGLGHSSDGLPDIGARSSCPYFPGIVFLSFLSPSGTLHLQVETLRNAARELYNVMRGITGRCELANGTLRWLRIIVEELEVAFGLVACPPPITSFQLLSD